MKKELTLDEFKNEISKARTIFLSSENQSWINPAYPVQFNFVFDNIYVGLVFPVQIVLHNSSAKEQGYVQINQITKIHKVSAGKHLAEYHIQCPASKAYPLKDSITLKLFGAL